MIVPWNSPLLLLSFKLAPALAAGCTVVVKPAEHTPASTLEFGRLVDEAGLPAGRVQRRHRRRPDDRPRAGRAPGRRQGRVHRLDRDGHRGRARRGRRTSRRCRWSWAASRPTSCSRDADLEAAANGVVAGIFAATGQTCMAGSRLFVHESVHDELVERVAGARARDPARATRSTPRPRWARSRSRQQLDKVAALHRSARGEGAALVVRRAAPDAEALRDGFFIEPTIFTGVARDMAIAREEIFGPVLSVMTFADEDEAIALRQRHRASGSRRGVWTHDVQPRAPGRARAARRHGVDQRLPRRLVQRARSAATSTAASVARTASSSIDEYTETKTVWVELQRDRRATRSPSVDAAPRLAGLRGVPRAADRALRRRHGRTRSRGARRTADVADALAYARWEGLPIAVRCGGHDFAGRSSTSGVC